MLFNSMNRENAQTPHHSILNSANGNKVAIYKTRQPSPFPILSNLLALDLGIFNQL